MFRRLLNPPNKHSFFIFGARGTGKSTWLREQWGTKHHYINLLLEAQETRYARRPDQLIEDLKALKIKPEWIVIDEVQKVPKLLDVVHELIETTHYRFVLTGSSARKLKARGTNLLAGRAFHYQMFPLTAEELADEFKLEDVLRWGSLPSLYSLESELERAEYLRSYTSLYLKEEILLEQIVRSGAAFKSFLEIAAQSNGTSINFTKMARDVGVDPKTIQNFFQILEDTHLGFLLPAFDRSVRKSLKHQPKFYLFDLGVCRALEGQLGQNLVAHSTSYGRAFEHFVILEVIRINHYKRLDFTISHYQTTAGGEIDLVLKRGRQIIALEIKSNDRVDELEVRKMARVSAAIKPTKNFYISQDPVSSLVEGVHCQRWKKFLVDLSTL